MKINLEKTLFPLKDQGFAVRESEIGGEICYLVFPTGFEVEWSKDNLLFRSSIWNSKGELISASFPKFFNWHEQPDISPAPWNLHANGGCNIIEKKDGSTLIVSKYQGQLIIRTRGTFDAKSLDNGQEIDFLKEKYPLAFEFEEETADYSRIFEWTTPSQRIVIEHKEPELHLINIIKHKDYSLSSQSIIPIIARKDLQVSYPERYSFGSIKEMIKEVTLFKDKEGVCVYYNLDQNIRKIKGDWYLNLHRLKSVLGSFDRVVDFFISNGCKSYQETHEEIVNTLDYEVAERVKEGLLNISEAMKEVEGIKKEIKNFILNSKLSESGTSRKEAAARIKEKYLHQNRCDIAFKILDGKDLEEKQIKKIIYQLL